MSTKRRGGGAGGRNVFRDDNFKWSFVNAIAHDVRIEFSGRCFAKVFLQFFAKQFWPGEINAISAPTPEEKFQNPLDVNKITCCLRIFFRKNSRGIMEDRAIRLFQRN